MDPHLELVELLVDGARDGDLEDVDSALAQHVAVDSKDAAGRTALHMACANGHEDVVRRLLEAGADVDIKNNEGNTPLHWACLNSHKGVVQALMEKQATASVLNAAGRTPVDEALAKDNQEIMDIINFFNGGSVEVEEVAEQEEELGEAAAEADEGQDEGQDGAGSENGPTVVEGEKA